MTKHGPEYARKRNEKYYTPAWCVDALLSVETFYGLVVDPAAGAGHILDALTAHGIENIGFDIEPDAPYVRGPLDFLQAVGNVANVVTNPPFGIGGRLGVKFIERALTLTKKRGGKVAMLLPLTFDAAVGRKHIFRDHPAYSGKIVLTKRIRWVNLEQKEAGPIENHQWACWDWRKPEHQKPTVQYV